MDVMEAARKRDFSSQRVALALSSSSSCIIKVSSFDDGFLATFFSALAFSQGAKASSLQAYCC